MSEPDVHSDLSKLITQIHERKLWLMGQALF